MTRPSDIATKPIACRVPMQDYIKFLTEASNKGMSISDWLLMKVYTSQPEKDEKKTSKSFLAAKEKEIGKLQKQIVELTKERDMLNAEVEAQKEKYDRIGDQTYNIYAFAKQKRQEVITGQDVIDFMGNLFPDAGFHEEG